MSEAYVEPEWAMVTVVFVDIRGFTSFADRATAREAGAYLDEFFGVVIPIVQASGGRLTRLLGDGLLTLYDAADHADRALATGVEVLDAVEDHFGEGCRIGIGINSGLVLVGTFGAAGVVELTAIGDPVNVAARAQAATRDLDEPLLLTDATRMLLEPGHAALEPRGALRLKGKARPVAVHALESRNDAGTLATYNPEHR